MIGGLQINSETISNNGELIKDTIAFSKQVKAEEKALDKLEEKQRKLEFEREKRVDKRTIAEIKKIEAESRRKIAEEKMKQLKKEKESFSNIADTNYLDDTEIVETMKAEEERQRSKEESLLQQIAVQNQLNEINKQLHEEIEQESFSDINEDDDTTSFRDVIYKYDERESIEEYLEAEEDNELDNGKYEYNTEEQFDIGDTDSTYDIEELEPEPIELEPEPIELEPEPIELEPEPVELEPEPIELEDNDDIIDAEPEPIDTALLKYEELTNNILESYENEEITQFRSEESNYGYEYDSVGYSEHTYTNDSIGHIDEVEEENTRFDIQVGVKDYSEQFTGELAKYRHESGYKTEYSNDSEEEYSGNGFASECDNGQYSNIIEQEPETEYEDTSYFHMNGYSDSTINNSYSFSAMEDDYSSTDFEDSTDEYNNESYDDYDSYSGNYDY